MDGRCLWPARRSGSQASAATRGTTAGRRSPPASATRARVAHVRRSTAAAPGWHASASCRLEGDKGGTPPAGTTERFELQSSGTWPISMELATQAFSAVDATGTQHPLQRLLLAIELA